MKLTNILLETSKDNNDDIFDQFARLIEMSKLNNNSEDYIDSVLDKINIIELHLDDLNSSIYIYDEGYNSQIQIITYSSKKLVKFWMAFFVFKQTFNIKKKILKDLNTLITILDSDNIKSFMDNSLTGKFHELFILNIHDFNVAIEYYVKQDKALIRPIDISSINDDELFDFLSRIYSKINVKDSIKHKHNYLKRKQYSWDLYLWINTNDASVANRFMYILSSTLSSIDGVEIFITNSGLGSFFQSWKMKFKNSISKDETKDIIDKAFKAFKAYFMGRHIAEVEKSNSENDKIEEEIKRMMPEAQVKEIHDLTVENLKLAIENQKQDLLYKKLKSKKMILELEKETIANNLLLSDVIAKSLLQIDSNFLIRIQELLILGRSETSVQIGNIEDIDSKTREEEINDSDELV